MLKSLNLEKKNTYWDVGGLSSKKKLYDKDNFWVPQIRLISHPKGMKIFVKSKPSSLLLQLVWYFFFKKDIVFESCKWKKLTLKEFYIFVV